MADADHHRDEQDEEPVVDLEVPEDEALAVEGGTTSNIMKTKHDTVKNSISNVR